MHHRPMGGDSDDYVISRIESAQSPHLPLVIDLGDANKKSLGFLPRAGFIVAANARHVVIATTPEGELAGYCLYHPTQIDVRIVHVCVAATHYGHGLARRLVDRVRLEHPEARGLRLKCRRDWDASKLWPKLGFQPITDVRGRSKAGHLLTVWWSPTGHEDLFTARHADLDALVVAVDTNVFSDLHSRKSPRRRRYSGAVALLEGEQEIEVALPFSVLAELNDTTDAAERKVFINTAARYRKLTGVEDDIGNIQRSLLFGVPQDVRRQDPSLEKDARFIAEAIAGGAVTFVTRDENALQYLGPAAFQLHGLAAMQPSELSTHMHRQRAREEYHPARLAETGLAATRGHANDWSGSSILALLNQPAGERKRDYLERLRDIAERSTTELDRHLLVDPEGSVIAAWAMQRRTCQGSGRLAVELLRVQAGDLRSTVARQLVFLLRREAIRRHATQVVLTDPHLDGRMVGILEEEGFAREVGAESPAAMVMTVLDQCAPWLEIRALAVNLGVPSVPAVDEMSAPQAAELERLWWPVKILDAALPNYVVSIRGGFADELLGHRPTLLARSTTLGLSREHVYYRASRGMPSAPGRVLWYSSGRDQQLVACSRLVESVTGAPEGLYREFRHLGVWNLRQVQGEPRRNVVGALRFADTEVFQRPIPLKALRGMSAGAARLPSQSPLQIHAPLFQTLYEEGRTA